MAKTNAKRRKSQDEDEESSNPPPQRVIEGGETSNPPPQKVIGGGETTNPFPTGGREEIAVTIEPDLLDCSICTYPLCPPLYQCMNGHVACPSCWSKVQHKCHICNVPVVTRNIALEKVLESVHVPCTYSNLGCHESVSYSHRQVHTDVCEFGLSLCPIPGCAHKASSGAWRGHFLKDHWVAGGRYGSHYSYGQSCSSVQFHEVDPYYTLLGPDKDLFLLVKEAIPNAGIALSLYYIDLPHMDQNIYSYELQVVSHENVITSSVKLTQAAVSIREWKRGEVRGNSLLVPLGFSLSGCFKLYVLINKKLKESWSPQTEEEEEEEQG